MLGLVKRLGAFALLVGLLVGFPALLLAAVGNPWPAGGLNELALMSNSAVLGIISLLGWFVWAQLLLCTLWEIPPALRHEPGGASRLPIAAGGQQRFMRMLIHTVLAVGVSSTTLFGAYAATADAVPATGWEPVAQLAHHAPAVATETSPVKGDADGAQEQRTGAATVRVVKGDTVWGLAEKHLGDGFRWQEIVDLNQGRVMPDGRTFHNPRTMQAGWDLVLPPDATHLPAQGPLVHGSGAEAGAETTHVVAVGETLSGIAQGTATEADTWRTVYEANRDVVGDDPDLILPGQILVFPGAGAGDRGADSQQPPPRHGDDERSATGKHAAYDERGANRNTTDNAMEDEQSPVPEVPATPTATSTALSPAQVAQGEARPKNPSAAEADESDMEVSPLGALLASAVCLSVGALGLIATNRRRQFRSRRIGRAIAATPDELPAVEQALVENGVKAQEDVTFLDRALRHVAASCKATNSPLPQLGAAVLGEEDLTLLFTSPADEAPEGWTATEDSRAWVLPRWTFLEEDLATQPAPYPALVSVGVDESGRTWMLDLEMLGICGIGGDPQQVADLIRFMVAELAVNDWAEGCEVLLADSFAAETIRVNPGRLRQVQRGDALARAAVLVDEMGEAQQNLSADVLTRRREGLLLDTAHPVVVVLASRPEGEFVSAVEHRDRSRVVLLCGDEESPAVELAGNGMAFLPMWGISVKALTMKPEHAAPMADLMAASRNLKDEPVPATQSDDGPLGKYARADGALREEYTEPRRIEGNDPTSQLPEADEVYLATAATTPEDLATAAPSVPKEVRAEIEALASTLDQDVADWFDASCPRPKVHLLGPAEVTSLNGGDPGALENLHGTVSFIAYLAAQDHGVTAERVAAAFGWKSVKTVQNRATNARSLLGTRPDGSDWLPDASTSSAARRGTSPTYELVRDAGGVLNSADLFLALKCRAQARGDQGCEEDLVTALSLVTGAPFEGATEQRYRWLFQPGRQRYDEILVGAIHDAAHVLATRSVAQGRTDLVRLACDAARKASPHSDISWLDQAAALEAEAGRDAAGELVREQVIDLFDEDLPPRSESIIDHRRWATG